MKLVDDFLAARRAVFGDDDNTQVLILRNNRFEVRLPTSDGYDTFECNGRLIEQMTEDLRKWNNDG